MRSSTHPHTLVSLPSGSYVATCAPQPEAAAFARVLASKQSAGPEHSEPSVPSRPICKETGDADGASDRSFEMPHSQVGGSPLANEHPSALPRRLRKSTLLPDNPHNDLSGAMHISPSARKHTTGRTLSGREDDGRQQALDDVPHVRKLQYDHAQMLPHVLHSVDAQVDHALFEQIGTPDDLIDIALELDPMLLPDTRATLRISHTDLLVRFETRHTGVVDLLYTHANTLAERLAKRTSKTASIEIAG